VTKPRIGQILVADGVLSDEAIVRALGFQKTTMEALRIGTILVNWELLAEEALLSALGKFHRCPYVTWATLSEASWDAIRILSPAHAIRLGAVPYALESRTLRVAFRNPSDLALIDETSQISGRRVVPAVTTEIRLALAQFRFYGHPLPPQFKPILQKLERRKTVPPGEPKVASAPGESADAGAPSPPALATASALYEYPPLPPSEEATEPPEPDYDSPAESLSTIEIPTFPESPDADAAGETRKPRSRDEILDPILEILRLRFPRVMLLGSGKSAITGWAGRGPGLAREFVAAINIPRTEEDVLGEVAASGVPHFGPVGRERYPQALRGLLDRDTCECAVFPIPVLGTVVGLLYADRLGEPLPYEDFGGLARGAAEAAQLLSGFLLRPG
jgi:hypothetical protein